MLKMLKLILKNRFYNEHYPSILVTFLGETEHFSRRIGALRWSIVVTFWGETEHFSGRIGALRWSILVTFLGDTEHFSGRIRALRWSILVGKQKHNVQKPTRATDLAEA